VGQAAHAGREAFDPPEITTADLAPLVLALAQWGVADPNSLAWLDPPPCGAVRCARAAGQTRCARWRGAHTARGRKLAALPMEPWQAAMLLYGAEHGAAVEAAKLALLLQERGLWRQGRGPRAAPVALERRPLGPRRARASSRRLGAARRQAGRREGREPAPRRPPRDGPARQPRAPPRCLRANRGCRPAGAATRSTGLRPLATAEWLAIGDAQGRAQAARITRRCR
jgi:ATP-dependent helicase HrpB